mmetsp:Transcript_2003/g.3112  ORF Transcript_2003/g.3112 Transcript_2003/m.3112 type:complete len:412 (-) Transcript_2003:23-1258(-)
MAALTENEIFQLHWKAYDFVVGKEKGGKLELCLLCHQKNDGKIFSHLISKAILVLAETKFNCKTFLYGRSRIVGPSQASYRVFCSSCEEMLGVWEKEVTDFMKKGRGAVSTPLTGAVSDKVYFGLWSIAWRMAACSETNEEHLRALEEMRQSLMKQAKLVSVCVAPCDQNSLEGACAFFPVTYAGIYPYAIFGFLIHFDIFVCRPPLDDHGARDLRLYQNPHLPFTYRRKKALGTLHGETAQHHQTPSHTAKTVYSTTLTLMEPGCFVEDGRFRFPKYFEALIEPCEVRINEEGAVVRYILIAKKNGEGILLFDYSELHLSLEFIDFEWSLSKGLNASAVTNINEVIGVVRTLLSRVFVREDGLFKGAKICCVCGKNKDIKRCSKCKERWYCGRDCQRHHWGHGHKERCHK